MKMILSKARQTGKSHLITMNLLKHQMFIMRISRRKEKIKKILSNEN